MGDYTLTVLLSCLAVFVAIFLKPRKTVSQRQREQANTKIDDDAESALNSAEKTHEEAVSEFMSRSMVIDSKTFDELSRIVNDEFDGTD